MPPAIADSQTNPSIELRLAVQQSRTASLDGALERLFAKAFEGLVYPQIWEDPVVDLEAMGLKPGHRVITIASGGCNALSYLTAEPEHILAVDLNPAHVALTRLKIEAARLLGYDAFLRLFGLGRSGENIRAYDRELRDNLDAETRAYWERRDALGRRRIERFGRGFHRHGLLGRFIGAAHLVSRLSGVRPEEMLGARSLEEQRALFDQRLAPVFDRKLVRWITDRRIGLYGLGIPPAQFDKLAAGRPMAEVLKERLRKLACDFPIEDNYFAWQAFGRRYEPQGSLPPYLQREHFETIRRKAASLEVERGSLTGVLGRHPAGSFDRYVLLDAQDWMTPEQLNALWTEIERTARPEARVIFRTAGEDDIVGEQVSRELLAAWRYEDALSRALTLKDRSAVYGAFHLYTRRKPQ